MGWKPRRSSISPEAFGVSCKSQPRTAFPSLSQRWKSHEAASHFLLSCVQRLCSLEGRGALCREEAIAQPAGSWLGWERALASPRPPCHVVIFIPRKGKSGRAVQQTLIGAGGPVSRSPGNDGAGLGIPSTSGQLERTVNHPSGLRNAAPGYYTAVRGGGVGAGEDRRGQGCRVRGPPLCDGLL